MSAHHHHMQGPFADSFYNQSPIKIVVNNEPKMSGDHKIKPVKTVKINGPG
jgi:hypothetical protein